MEQRKGLSFKVDETIESFLQFLGRYVLTIISLIRHPLSPERLLNDYEQQPHSFVRPLTFLTIGAFCFSLLISVFPEGIRALPFILFEADAVKTLIKDRWKDAFTVTTLFTTGMPTIVAIVLFSKLAGKLFLKELPRRTKWFHLNCYVFGGQMILIFIIFFLDAFIDSVVLLVPSLAQLPLSDTVYAWLGFALILFMVGVAVICPMLILVTGHTKLADVPHIRRERIQNGILSILYFCFLFYSYPAIASLLPSLESKYFPKPEPEGRIVSYKAESFSQEKEQYSFEFSMLINNPSSKDFVMEIEPYDVEFQWGVSEEEPDEVWDVNAATALLKEPLSLTPIAIIPKNKKQQLLVVIEDAPLADIYCEAAHLEKSEDANDSNEPLNSFNLRVEFDGIEETMVIDLETFFGLEFFELDEIITQCESRA